MNTAIRVQPVRTTEVTTTVVGYMIWDNKDRHISAHVEMWEVDMVPSENGSGTARIAPGHYFVARVQMHRGDRRYGAFQSERHFTSADERFEAVNKTIAGSMKRAARQFPSTEPKPLSDL